MNFHPIEDSSATAKIVVPQLIEMYKPKSVIDFGCNTGAWLAEFIKHGVTDVLGVDGSNMEEHLVIPRKNFLSADICFIKPPLPRFYHHFDLLLCLEVAEHIEEKYADTLVMNAIKGGKTIIWSAATPGQGGYNHVNEQPHEYWIAKFAAYGLKHRLLADQLPQVPHDYYRKNAIEFIQA